MHHSLPLHLESMAMCGVFSGRSVLRMAGCDLRAYLRTAGRCGARRTGQFAIHSLIDATMARVDVSLLVHQPARSLTPNLGGS
jgi:hypothetical protein